MIVAVAIAYFAACVLLGYGATRRTQTIDDFYVAGRNIGLVTFAITAMATTLSGFAFIGGPGLVYVTGMTAVFIILPAAITNTAGAWILGKRLRLLGQLRGLRTIPEAIGARYRSRAVQGWGAVAILVGIVGYMATNFLALGVVVDSVFATGLTQGIWIGAVITIVYSASGGILAGIWLDVFQGVVMAATSTIVFVRALDAGQGLAAITRTVQSVDPALLGPWGAQGAMVALSFFFVFAVGSLGQPHLAHKYYMLKDVRQLKWYPALMTVAMILAQLLFVGVGFAVHALVTRGDMQSLLRADEATPQFMLQYVAPFVAALAFAGLASATMSAVTSFINIGAAAITHDLPSAFGRKPTASVGRARFWTIAIAVAGVILAQQSGTLVAFLGIFGYGLFACTLVPALAIGLNWEGATREGALASIITGLLLVLGLETAAWLKLFSLPTGVTVTGLALVTSLLVFVIVSLATRARATSQLDDDIRAVMQA